MSEGTGRRHYKFREVCVRLEEGKTLYSDRTMSNPESAVDVMRRELSLMDREMLCVINMNTKLNPINFNVVSIGTLSSAPAEISNIFKSAILSNSACIMVMHNHPSGSCTPSTDDIEMTKRIVAAGELMNIRLLDHIIVGGQSGGMYSMRDNHVVDFEMPSDLKEIRRLLSSNVSEKDSVLDAIKAGTYRGRSADRKKVSEAER